MPYPITYAFLVSFFLFICLFISTEKEGPIHDVSWSPTGKEFVVTYGCIIYNFIFSFDWFLYMYIILEL